MVSILVAGVQISKCEIWVKFSINSANGWIFDTGLVMVESGKLKSGE